MGDVLTTGHGFDMDTHIRRHAAVRHGHTDIVAGARVFFKLLTELEDHGSNHGLKLDDRGFGEERIERCTADTMQVMGDSPKDRLCMNVTRMLTPSCDGSLPLGCCC